ncbi:hypothetical protein HDU76_001409 [Blyttiomyces sp. JEL0837]|nr:hypothetical protein HDU76_001409 [Blyttiomyces sp. JEL0837]
MGLRLLVLVGVALVLCRFSGSGDDGGRTVVDVADERDVVDVDCDDDDGSARESHRSIKGCGGCVVMVLSSLHSFDPNITLHEFTFYAFPNTRELNKMMAFTPSTVSLSTRVFSSATKRMHIIPLLLASTATAIATRSSLSNSILSLNTPRSLSTTTTTTTGPSTHNLIHSKHNQSSFRHFTSSSESESEYPYTIYTTPSSNKSIALSYVESPVKSDHVVLGWLNVSGGNDNAGNSWKGFLKRPDMFVANDKFMDIVHQVIRDNAHLDQGLQALAQHQKEGYLHVNDARVFAPWGRVNDPEDIFGSVLVKDGVMVENSYQRMPTHRPMSMNGLFQLSEFLQTKLVEQLKR